MTCYVYVLYSLSYKVYYVGSSEDVEKRVINHNLGMASYTKGRRPWKLVYTEEYNSRSEAVRREKFLKSGQGRELLKQKFDNLFKER